MAKTQRIDKVLANLGYGSRKDIKRFCKDGLVKIDGEIIKDSSVHINPEDSEIIIDGEVISYREFVYYDEQTPGCDISDR